jgi:cation:H+ antiporter
LLCPLWRNKKQEIENMIYAAYLVVAVAVVLLSIKASEYVDLLDKKTKLSGAFIGGVMLSAVTSLPELFTSLSSTVFLDKPGLCMGNILGSDLFNVTALCVVILVGMKGFSGAGIAKSHALVNLSVCMVYAVLLLNKLGVLDVQLFHVNIITLIIIVLYIWGVRSMSSDDGGAESAEEEENYKGKDLPVKTIVIRFIAVSICIVAFSILITYITDAISVKLNLGAGLAGALFLGIATSLPELSSTIALFRIKNYNIAIGNIVGSNIFNFIIIALADLVYLKGGVYDYSDPKTVDLLLLGAIAMPMMQILLKFKNKATQIICPICVVACYAAFLLI